MLHYFVKFAVDTWSKDGSFVLIKKKINHSKTPGIGQ